MRAIQLSTTLGLIACAATVAQAEELQRFSQVEPQMGVEFEVVVYAADQAAAEKAIAAAFDRIAALNKIMSDYDTDSELSRLSAAAPTPQPVQISDELMEVLTFAQQVREDSGGAFDVTVGPLTKLWRQARRSKRFPKEEQVAAARAAVGGENLHLNTAKKTAALAKPGMKLDLGGIAKGYAADEALAVIRRLGITRALVRGSGDIVAGDAPPGQTGWKVGIAPLNPDDPPQQFLWIANQAVSTSGDSRQHLIAAGKRYSHILDPQTGYGVTRRGSVTVIAPRGIAADSLASAVSVLGPERGLKLIEATKDAAALVVTEENGELKTYESSRFAKWKSP